MVWIRRALKILQVAGSAGCASQVVVVVDVAIGADSRRIGMRVRERETYAGVVEFGIQPRAGAVTGFACGGKTRRYVIRIRCRLEIVCVARVTLR